MKRVEVQTRRRLLDGFFTVDEVEVAFERFDGSMSPPLRRLVADRGDSAAAVVFDPVARQLLFTEQFRFPTVEKGPGWLLELMAGSVDARETPDEAIRREIEEELGYRAASVEHITTFYVSPGGASERVWLYYVETTRDGRIAGGGGLESEGEDIRVVAMPLDTARDTLAAGGFADAKTIIGLQWLFFQRRPTAEG